MGTSCEDDMTKPLITQKALIVVRTYPVPAMRGVEVSCTAAITDEGKWLRFHPVPYRFLDPDQRFRKYQWVQVRISKGSDPRPESYKLSPGSLQVLSRPLPSSENWRQRKNVVLPLRSPSLCALRRAHDENGSPTLGLFRPRTIRRLLIEPDDPSWSDAQLAALRQGSLFDEGEPKIELEKVPFRFRYEFQCEDPGCHTWHRLICTDWEMGQAWRRWRDKYGKGWEKKFRQRFETEMMTKYDTHFFVGTVFNHPGTWIIVGLFYPPRAKELPLLEC